MAVSTGCRRKAALPRKAIMNKTKKPIGTLLFIIIIIFAILAIVAGFMANWMLRTWQHLTMEELIFHLKAPVEGTGSSIITSALIMAGIPILVSLIILFFLAKRLRPRLSRGTGLLILFLIIAVIAGEFAYTGYKLDFITWLKSETGESSFIEDNYVDPASVKITAPEKKRNLIYIFLESVETTYSDTAHGGAFDVDVIPELTELAQENEDFSGSDPALNGGVPLRGATWTMGGMFAHSSGLPLITSIGENNMDTQKAFFPGTRTLGDILKDEGYQQTLLVGSYAGFGGRELYYRTHGDYAIHDLQYARDSGWIPEDYKVWWGFEDNKLFEFAKKDLNDMAASGEPFNLTLLTADTHFEDGYQCEDCPDTYPDDPYATSMACSSKKVNDFINWIKEQDFYENTTIILAGDHLTMDSDFCQNVPDDYERRVLVSVINGAASPADPDRVRSYTTFDLFPTTLAAMGYSIEGDRLGLGTDLYSPTDTLSESLGMETFSEKLYEHSDFLDKLAAIDTDSELLQERENHDPEIDLTILENDPAKDRLVLELTRIKNIEEPITGVTLTVEPQAGGKPCTADAVMRKDRVYEVTFDMEVPDPLCVKVTAVVHGESRDYEGVVFEGDLSFGFQSNLSDYLALLNRLRDDERYTTLLVVADEGTEALTWIDRDGFAALGLETDLVHHYRDSYYAIIRKEGITEEAASQRLTYEGTLPDGASLSLVSAGFEFGNEASVAIDGTEYAGSETGMHFVVYDSELSRVVSTAYFNTHKDEHPAFYLNMAIEKTENKTFSFVITDSPLAGYMGRVYAYIWDEKTYTDPVQVEFKRLNDGKVIAEGSLKGIDLSQCYLELYLHRKTNETILLGRWSGDLTGGASITMQGNL